MGRVQPARDGGAGFSLACRKRRWQNGGLALEAIMQLRRRYFGFAVLTIGMMAAAPLTAQQTNPPPANPPATQPATQPSTQPATQPAVQNREERHDGYYYPPVSSRETYSPRSKRQPEATRTTRIAFATEISNKMISATYPPLYAIFAKGDDGEKLIIVAISDNYFGNLYRGRALLAMLTAQARTTPIFTKFGVEDFFTFFDLAHMLGYKQITISDGKTYTHQITLK